MPFFLFRWWRIPINFLLDTSLDSATAAALKRADKYLVNICYRLQGEGFSRNQHDFGKGPSSCARAVNFIFYLTMLVKGRKAASHSEEWGTSLGKVTEGEGMRFLSRAGLREEENLQFSCILDIFFPSGNKTTVYALPLSRREHKFLRSPPQEFFLWEASWRKRRGKTKFHFFLTLAPFLETKIDFPKDFRTIIGAHYGGVSLDLLFRQPFLMLRSLWHRLFESRCGIFLKSIKRFCGERGRVAGGRTLDGELWHFH